MKPDFFIVGAPRCGTTALYTWLRAHPDVFLPDRKEPRFFAPDLDAGSRLEAHYFVRSEEAYLRLFAAAGSARRVGEASALYLYSRVAARRIQEVCGDVRIIAMLRDPVDLMYAFHGERYFNGNEDIADFAEALAAEPARKRGERIPRGAVIPAALQYREVARLASQIERYVEVFGRERLFFILLEDLADDPRAVYRETLRFLDVDEEFVPAFGVVNPSKRLRSSAVRDLTRRPPDAVLRLVRRMVPLHLREGVKRGIRSWNVVRVPRPPLDPDLRRRLAAEFRSEVERLEAIVGRDLSHWKADR